MHKIFQINTGITSIKKKEKLNVPKFYNFSFFSFLK